MMIAIEERHASCPLSAAEITSWTKKLKLPGAMYEQRLQLLTTYWYAQAVSLLPVEKAYQGARVRLYVKRRLALGHSLKEIALPPHFDRVDRWLPEIAGRLMAIQSELLTLPGDVEAALHMDFDGYETAIGSISALARTLNDVAKSWYRPHRGQPSREEESSAIELLVCAVEDFTGETFPSPRSYKRLYEIELARSLASRLFPSSTSAEIGTMFRHFHKGRLKNPGRVTPHEREV